VPSSHADRKTAEGEFERAHRNLEGSLRRQADIAAADLARVSPAAAGKLASAIQNLNSALNDCAPVLRRRKSTAQSPNSETPRCAP
jgi:hypothetical protein